MVPPAIGIGLANFLSRKSRAAVSTHEQHFFGEDKEWLMIHSKAILQNSYFDYFIYGHRHVPGIHPLPGGSQYVNLGDWIMHFTYAEYDGSTLNIKTWQ